MDGFTEGMLNRLDKDVRKKFNVSLIDVMEDPSSFLGDKGFAVKLSRISDYVDKETEKMVEQSKSSGRSFHETASKADELTRKMGSYVSSHARQSNVPFVKPADVKVPRRGTSIFYISEMDDSTARFLEKLVESSAFIADTTKSYDNMKVGSWMFAGDRISVVAVHAPRNSLMLVKEGRAQIMKRLKEASDSVKGL